MNDGEAVNTVRNAEKSAAKARSGQVPSRDGTLIAYNRAGRGPAVVVVDGALCTRSFGPAPQLATALAERFTVLTYDRRGRGESADGGPYAIEREVEDLAAILREAGGSACVVGVSSGAVLALRAAAVGLPIEKLALYEAPFIVDRSRPTMEPDWEHIDAAVGAGRSGDAARIFLKMVGVPAVVVAIMRWMPLWKGLEATAATLPRDGALVREFQRGQPLPADRWAGIAIPVLAMSGGKSPAWLRNGMEALARALPRGRHLSLEGQTHDLKAKVVAPVLSDFFSDRAS
jgi:pimeloyl-ACP methyl ester carboxylesterase